MAVQLPISVAACEPPFDSASGDVASALLGGDFDAEGRGLRGAAGQALTLQDADLAPLSASLFMCHVTSSRGYSKRTEFTRRKNSTPASAKNRAHVSAHSRM